MTIIICIWCFCTCASREAVIVWSQTLWKRPLVYLHWNGSEMDKW